MLARVKKDIAIVDVSIWNPWTKKKNTCNLLKKNVQLCSQLDSELV